MQRTLIQLKKDFQEIATKHRQINSFFWGDFTDAISHDAVDYPLMVCTLQPSSVGENYVGVDLVVIIADKYNEQDYRVIDEVHNDSLLICKDIEVTLRQFRFSDILDLETDLTNTPFINRGHDITAGWSMNVRMEVYDFDNPCVIPYDGYDFENGGSTVGCQPSTITLDNTLGTELSVTSVASGASDTIVAPDGTSNINKSSGALIQAVSVPSGAVVATSIADSVITLQNTAATPLSTTNVLATDAATIVAPDATVNNSDGTYTASVASGGVLALPDSVIKVNSVSQGSVVSVKAIDVNIDVTPTSSTLVGNVLTIVAPKDLEINIPYSTSDTTASITILSGSNGTITSADTTGLTSVTYEINAVAATLPLTLAVADVLTINFDAAAADGVIKLSGTYA